MTVAKLELPEPISKLISQIEEQSQTLSENRKQLLSAAAEKATGLQREQGEANLLFVCTHNSRRSHFSDFWARVAIECYSPKGISSFSCGTETTECNPRTVASLGRSGFEVSSDGSEQNPHYEVIFGSTKLELFSKAFGDASLPTSNVVAMMCCDDADEKCPIIPGAEHRVPLHYQDPKASDGTDVESATYDERSLQIAAEMFFLVKAICG